MRGDSLLLSKLKLLHHAHTYKLAFPFIYNLLRTAYLENSCISYLHSQNFFKYLSLNNAMCPVFEIIIY